MSVFLNRLELLFPELKEEKALSLRYDLHIIVITQDRMEP